MADRIQTFWDRQAKNYDHSERQFEPIFRDIVAKTKGYLLSGDKVLDFGCATGTKTFQLADAVQHIHGIDLSPGMIEKATRKGQELDISNVTFLRGTIFEGALKKESFDKIISYGVLHLVEDREKVIQRIYELLKPGGMFISSTACLKDKMAIKNKIEFSLYTFIKDLGIFPLRLNMFATRDVENLVINGGFQIVEAVSIFHGITISFIVAKK